MLLVPIGLDSVQDPEALGCILLYDFPTCLTGDEVMPTYQYRCEQCRAKFKRTESIAKHEAEKPRCPKCGSEKVSWIPGQFFTVTSKKS